MLIANLYNMFSGEVKYPESRQDCVSPDVIEKKANTVIVPEKFKTKPWRIISGTLLKPDSASRLTWRSC